MLNRPKAQRFTNIDSTTTLVLDVDNALLRTDLLYESAVAFVKVNPLHVFLLLYWLWQGKAVLKRRLADRVKLDFSVLPVNDALEAHARAQHDAGRPVCLATASDELLAIRLAQRFDFIDRVIASDGERNLKGPAKAEVVAQHFPQGFTYAADHGSDLHVWRKASGIILVNASAKTTAAARALGKPIEAEFRAQGLGLKGWLKALRVHQWSKNVLVFVPLVLGGLFWDVSSWMQAGLALIALNLMASSTYLINDVWDIEDDRRHWTKRNRPLASGRMSLKQAAIAAPGLLAISLGVGMLLGTNVLAVLLAYLVLTLGYSFAFKRKPVLDTFVLATLFTLRLVLGIAAVGVASSAWLLVFSMFLFTSLSFAKRLTEVLRFAEKNGDRDTLVSGRGYFVRDTPLILSMGVSSGMASIMMMVLYLTQDAFRVDFYGNSAWLWAIPAALFLWVSRIWMIAQRGELLDDPVVFAMRDPKSLILCGAVVVSFVMGWLGLPF